MLPPVRCAPAPVGCHLSGASVLERVPLTGQPGPQILDLVAHRPRLVVISAVLQCLSVYPSPVSRARRSLTSLRTGRPRRGVSSPGSTTFFFRRHHFTSPASPTTPTSGKVFGHAESGNWRPSRMIAGDGEWACDHDPMITRLKADE